MAEHAARINQSQTSRALKNLRSSDKRTRNRGRKRYIGHIQSNTLAYTVGGVENGVDGGRVVCIEINVDVRNTFVRLPGSAGRTKLHLYSRPVQTYFRKCKPLYNITSGNSFMMSFSHIE
jgi:hypothetical protein